MAIVSGIPVDDWQLAELEHVDFPDELHLVKEPDGRWTVDNGNMIVFEFIPANRQCPDCGGITSPEDDGYRFCANCGWDTIEQQRRDVEEDGPEEDTHVHEWKIVGDYGYKRTYVCACGAEKTEL